MVDKNKTDGVLLSLVRKGVSDSAQGFLSWRFSHNAIVQKLDELNLKPQRPYDKNVTKLKTEHLVNLDVG